MTILRRIAGTLLLGSLLGLAGCPIWVGGRDGRGEGQRSEEGHHRDDRGDHDDSRRDEPRDRDRRSDDDHPR